VDAVPFLVIISPDVRATVAEVQRVAQSALSQRRIKVIVGDRGRQQYPTEEVVAAIKTFYNRSRSDRDYRVQRLGVLLHRFFPSGRAVFDAEATARKLALDAGFPDSGIVVVRANSSVELEDRLRDMSLSDAVRTVEPQNFAEAFAHFAEEFGDAVVSQRALDGAKNWSYTQPSEILRDLRVIHRVYGRLLDANGNPLDPKDRKKVLQAETGLVLGYESPDAIKKYRTAHFPEMKDSQQNPRQLEFPIHAKYGQSDTRIYFWFPALSDRYFEPIKTLIADAGKHLPTGGKGDR
jgi:hypothetical protein